MRDEDLLYTKVPCPRTHQRHTHKTPSDLQNIGATLCVTAGVMDMSLIYEQPAVKDEDLYIY